MNLNWASINSISAIDPEEFSLLTPTGKPEQAKLTPFLSRDFLLAMEESDSVGTIKSHTSGWLSSHITIRDDSDTLVAFIPAYIKDHSYGEYVFDHSWAQAYHQHGLAYYPKLVCAVPFTPVTGTRLLVNRDVDISEQQLIKYVGNSCNQLMEKLDISSVHILFSDVDTSRLLEKQGFHQRQSVQFNWHNKSYQSFDDFLNTLTARRRRSIKKERKNIGRQNVDIRRIHGDAIASTDMAFFYQCYMQTYLKRSGHTGYLSKAFFDQVLNTMRAKLLLVIALKDNQPIACALFFFDHQGLYGRYWGALPMQRVEKDGDDNAGKLPLLYQNNEISGLHFEACYYQGIEFCIEQNIPYFNPGTQGEHKILRGFEPTLCYSNHRMKESAFDTAVANFLTKETPQIQQYAQQAAQLLPFKQSESDSDTH